MRKYFDAWQLLPLTAFFLASVIVGGLLLKRLLTRAFADVASADQPRRRRSRLSTLRCMLAMLLAALGAGFAAACIMALFLAIDDASPRVLYWAYITGGILTLLAMPAVAYVVLLAMFPLPARRMVWVVLPIFLLVLAFAAVTFTPTGLIAYRQQVLREHQAQTGLNLAHIDDALRDYELRHNVPAPSLSALAEGGYIEPEYLRSPADPEGDIGYFYMPKRSAPARMNTDELRVCDYRDNFDGRGRAILTIDGSSRWVSEEQFQDLLQMDVNQDFAQALREAEGG